MTQSAAGSESAGQTGTMHWILNTGATFPHPLEKVWSEFRDMRAWYTEYTWDVVSGTPYEAGRGLAEGQTLRLRSSHPLPQMPDGSEKSGTDDFMTTVLRVVPPTEIVCVLSGRIQDWKRYTSFYVWRLASSGPNTEVFVDAYGEAELTDPLPVPHVAEYVASFEAEGQRSWSDAFANLRNRLDV